MQLQTSPSLLCYDRVVRAILDLTPASSVADADRHMVEAWWAELEHTSSGSHLVSTTVDDVCAARVASQSSSHTSHSSSGAALEATVAAIDAQAPEIKAHSGIYGTQQSVWPSLAAFWTLLWFHRSLDSGPVSSTAKQGMPQARSGSSANNSVYARSAGNSSGSQDTEHEVQAVPGKAACTFGAPALTTESVARARQESLLVRMHPQLKCALGGGVPIDPTLSGHIPTSSPAPASSTPSLTASATAARDLMTVSPTPAPTTASQLPTPTTATTSPAIPAADTTNASAIKRAAFAPDKAQAVATVEVGGLPAAPHSAPGGLTLAVSDHHDDSSFFQGSVSRPAALQSNSFSCPQRERARTASEARKARGALGPCSHRPFEAFPLLPPISMPECTGTFGLAEVSPSSFLLLPTLTPYASSADSIVTSAEAQRRSAQHMHRAAYGGRAKGPQRRNSDPGGMGLGVTAVFAAYAIVCGVAAGAVSGMFAVVNGTIAVLKGGLSMRASLSAAPRTSSAAMLDTPSACLSSACLPPGPTPTGALPAATTIAHSPKVNTCMSQRALDSWCESVCLREELLEQSGRSDVTRVPTSRLASHQSGPGTANLEPLDEAGYFTDGAVLVSVHDSRGGIGTRAQIGEDVERTIAADEDVLAGPFALSADAAAVTAAAAGERASQHGWQAIRIVWGFTLWVGVRRAFGLPCSTTARGRESCLRSDGIAKGNTTLIVAEACTV